MTAIPAKHTILNKDVLNKIRENVKVTCQKCKYEDHPDNMWSVHNNGETEYECMENNKCYQRTNAEKIAQRNIEKEQEQKYGHLEKETQFETRYNLEYEDLEELPCRFRDASIHYRHSGNGEFYTWCWGSKVWQKPRYDLSSYVDTISVCDNCGYETCHCCEKCGEDAPENCSCESEYIL